MNGAPFGEELIKATMMIVAASFAAGLFVGIILGMFFS